MAVALQRCVFASLEAEYCFPRVTPCLLLPSLYLTACAERSSFTCPITCTSLCSQGETSSIEMCVSPLLLSSSAGSMSEAPLSCPPSALFFSALSCPSLSRELYDSGSVLAQRSSCSFLSSRLSTVNLR